MSQVGQTRLSGAMLGSSVKPPKADIWRPVGNVAEVPQAVVRFAFRVGYFSGNPALRSASIQGSARVGSA
jgi:hypothetical protein